MLRSLLNILPRRNTLLFTLILLTLTLAPPDGQLSLISPVQAATINVDSTCTINQAIASANSDSTASGSSCEAGSGADTINISGRHNTTANLPAINTTITIIGSSQATINGGNRFRNFLLNAPGNLTLRNLTITGGRSQYGGAVRQNAGSTLTIENSVIHGNTASDVGGGVDSFSTLTIKNSVFHNNYARTSSGAALSLSSGTVTVENSTFYNHARDSAPASVTTMIILAGANATFTHVTMTGNKNVINRFAGSVHLRNSIISDSAGFVCRGGLSTNVGNLIDNGSCSPKVRGNPMLGPWKGYFLPLLPGSPAIDAAVAAHCLPTDQRGVARASAACDIGAIEYAPLSDAPESAAEEETAYVPPPPSPPTYTGQSFFERTGIRVSATHGLRSGVQFKRIDASGIGLPEVLNNGFIDAVDVFGYVEQGVEVCFPQSGALIFLDAATSPRTVLPWPSTIVDGFTCGRITRPGTLVLVPLNSPLAGPVSTPQPAPGAQIQSNQTGLTDCYLTTTHILNLRESPGGDIIGRVNYKATLSARGRNGPWYRVSVDGLSGWISADFVRTRGNCS